MGKSIQSYIRDFESKHLIYLGIIFYPSYKKTLITGSVEICLHLQ